MVLQLCALVLETDVGPLLVSKAACTGFREYWNEKTGSCTDSCGSGFYETDGEVKVCSACDGVTQFVTDEKYNIPESASARARIAHSRTCVSAVPTTDSASRKICAPITRKKR